MSNQLLINQRDHLIGNNRFSKSADAINKALDDQLEQFFMLGARNVARIIDNGLLTMMKVNVRNPKLSDADCRQLMDTLIDQWQGEIDHIYKS